MKHTLAAAALLLAACVAQPQHLVLPVDIAQDQAVRGLVRAALEADATGASADTMYIVGATIVADGRVRLMTPRFAGVELGGQLIIASLQAEITSTLAWAVTDYRWRSSDGRRGAFGRATVVLEPWAGAWRIKHVHSSSARP